MIQDALDIRLNCRHKRENKTSGLYACYIYDLDYPIPDSYLDGLDVNYQSFRLPGAHDGSTAYNVLFAKRHLKVVYNYKSAQLYSIFS